MKKLEQSILVILIVTCIGMCLGSILIAFQRSKGSQSKLEENQNQIFFRPSEEDQINELLKNQVYPALMHHQKFPSSLFNTSSNLLNTEEDRFYFVFEMMRTSMSGEVLCDDILDNQCRVKSSDFQSQAMKIFGRRINMSLILNDYIYTPEMQQLDGINQICGAYWRKENIYEDMYSVLKHSVGVALIIWNFTQNKKQTIAGLLHDISSPAFKHCIDFLNGDAEKQESTEEQTLEVIKNSKEIMIIHYLC